MGTPSGFGARWVTPDTRRFQRRAQVHTRMRACVHLLLFFVSVRAFFFTDFSARTWHFFLRQMCVFWLMWARSICFVPFVAEPKGWCEKYRRCFLVRAARLLESETVFLPAITLTLRQSCRVLWCEVLCWFWQMENRGIAARRFRRHFRPSITAPSRYFILRVDLKINSLH